VGAPPQLRVAVLGFGYWGPNLVRNFTGGGETRVVAVVDPDPARRAAVGAHYPWVETHADPRPVLDDPGIDAVVVATPLAHHESLARAALLAGKHVLVEKPLAPSVRACEALAELAERQRRVLMVDHTFVYTGAVRKIRELVATGTLGRVLYFDAVRINLGVFQPDTSVLWDLAPHDLSILDFVLGGDRRPEWVSAVGVSHYGKQESLAYVHVAFGDSLIAHLHVNWLAPVKTRRITLAGTERMLVYDATLPVEPVKVYERSVDLRALDREAAYALNVQYRTGDVLSPKIDGQEALAHVASTFAGACLRSEPTPSGPDAALRVVRLIEAAQRSLEQGGARVCP